MAARAWVACSWQESSRRKPALLPLATRGRRRAKLRACVGANARAGASGPETGRSHRPLQASDLTSRAHVGLSQGRPAGARLTKASPCLGPTHTTPGFPGLGLKGGRTVPGGQRSTRTHVCGRGFGLGRPPRGRGQRLGCAQGDGSGRDGRKPCGHTSWFAGDHVVDGFGCWMVALGCLEFGAQLCDGPDRELGEHKTDNTWAQSGTRLRALVCGVSRGLWCVIHSFTFQQLPRLDSRRHPPSTHCRIGPTQNPAKQRHSCALHPQFQQD